MLRTGAFAGAVLVCLLVLLPTATAGNSLPGNRFQVSSQDYFLTGQSSPQADFLLAETVPAQGNQPHLLPGVDLLGIVSNDDAATWASARQFGKDTEIAAAVTAELYFTANVQALAVFRVRLFDLAPDGMRVVLAQDEQQFVSALDPTPVRFHMQAAGRVIQAGHTLLFEVEAETAQGVVLLQYGGDTPSGLRGLAVRFLDSDADGVADSDEVALGTNPLSPDFAQSDGRDDDDDGLADDVERALGLDPTKKDTDGDGFWDGIEFHAGSDALDPDSTPVDQDGDGLPDVFETNYFTTINNPLANPTADPDGDGCNNLCEAAHGTDPNNPDTDGDGVSDGDELHDRTNPLSRLSVDTVSGIPEPVAAAAAFAIGTTLCLAPLVRRP